MHVLPVLDQTNLLVGSRILRASTRLAMQSLLYRTDRPQCPCFQLLALPCTDHRSNLSVTHPWAIQAGGVPPLTGSVPRL
ncbi:hypothetical protein TsFJ059_007170 [Trichoderma semiorbis]|uniref:Uncharacterized protein n=1 Tax=Trichoderma semiorbis TaxID=1491008 RepID=A0A9P8KSC6_9HYPO|nr:hypothetical protein TsFJ059_007170 [Trichoderma semiorbis]